MPFMLLLHNFIIALSFVIVSLEPSLLEENNRLNDYISKKGGNAIIKGEDREIKNKIENPYKGSNETNINKKPLFFDTYVCDYFGWESHECLAEDNMKKFYDEVNR